MKINREPKDPKTRGLAQSLSSFRSFEKSLSLQTLTRNRPASSYITSLKGLERTLRYVSTLPAKSIVDLGAGSSRAIAELQHSKYGADLTFKGVGLIPDARIAQNIGTENYKITSGERMKGFGAESIGGFISVHGAISYSDHLDLVLSKINDLLVPGGIVKICLARFAVPGIPDKENADAESQKRIAAVESFFKVAGYAFAVEDREYSSKYGKGTDRIYLALKPRTDGLDLDDMAKTIMERDFETSKEMEAIFASK